MTDRQTYRLSARGTDDFRIKLGQTLKTARSEGGWTQVELARSAQIAAATIARIETGQVDPSVSTIGRLFHALNAVLEIRLDPFDPPDSHTT